MDARDLLEQPDFVPPEIKDIEITEAAINRLLKVGYKQVEFSVEGGGCSGMNYKMTKLDREPKDDDKIIKEGDLELVIPFSSFVYLLGTKIDFSDDLLNGGFKFSNPQANRTCGCGTSFSV
tara:strand:+ start:1058 stop:1420 length:363 start_codon:yes stop_codon:yes gene_type:complete